MLRDECSGYSSRTLARYGETLFLQNIHDQLRRLDLLERELSELPHFVSDAFNRGYRLLDCLVNAVIRWYCHTKYSFLKEDVLESVQQKDVKCCVGLPATGWQTHTTFNSEMP